MSDGSATRRIAKTAIAAWHTRLGKGRLTGEYATPIEDRIPFTGKLAYGMGAFVNNLLAAAIGGMLIILNLGFGMDPALVGLRERAAAHHRRADRSADGLHLGSDALALGATSSVHLHRRDPRRDSSSRCCG